MLYICVKYAKRWLVITVNRHSPWEESLPEEWSRLGWHKGIPVRDSLNFTGKTYPEWEQHRYWAEPSNEEKGESTEH